MADSDTSDNSSGNHESDTCHTSESPELSPSRRLTVEVSELEKDTELLAKKAKKRLAGQFNGRSENMIEKFVGWLRRKKVAKIQTMLGSLFPKLKHSEEEIKSWVNSVKEKKEVATVFGRVLLSDLEHQISLYQAHMEFLDEVINDVRQLDYDVVKEISELRVALHFNQEVLRKSRDTVVHVSDSSVKSTEENGCVKQDEKVDGVAVGHQQRVGGSLSRPTTTTTSPLSPTSTDAVSNQSLQKSELSDGLVEHDLEEELERIAVWDGAESKRKSLASRSISINSLPLSQTETCKSSREETKSSEKLGFARSLSRKGTKALITNIFRKSTPASSSKQADADNSLLCAVTRLGSRRKSTGHDDSSRLESTPIRKRADSTSSGVSSSSDAPSRSGGEVDSSSANLSSLGSSKKRYKNGRDNVGLKLSSFLQILPDEFPPVEAENGDSDEEELIRRINKCLHLKNILRVILRTIQETQEIEVASLKKMKQLKKELSELVRVGSEYPFEASLLNSATEIESQMLALSKSGLNSSKLASLSREAGSSQHSSVKTQSSNGYGPIIKGGDSFGTESVSSFPKDDIIGGSESDASFNYSDDSKQWIGELSHGSDGTHSPRVLKYGQFVYDDKRKSLLLPVPLESLDSASIASTSSQVENSAFHDAASDFIDDLKALVIEEQIAAENLSKLQALIESASQIDAKLNGATVEG